MGSSIVCEYKSIDIDSSITLQHIMVVAIHSVVAQSGKPMPPNVSNPRTMNEPRMMSPIVDLPVVFTILHLPNFRKHCDWIRFYPGSPRERSSVHCGPKYPAILSLR